MRIVLLLMVASVVQAHNGPPYAILVDKNLGPAKVSVWSNPDVGTGSFFVMLEGNVPADTKVDIGVQPVSGRLPESVYPTKRADMRGQIEYDASVPFDKEESWRVRVILTSSQGGGETSVNVDVTPPGYGRWDLLLYVLPFLGAGFLWGRAILKKRSRRALI